MPAKPLFHNDKLESLVRKCIVFPANSSKTCIVPMVTRTVTTEDHITSLTSHSRCVDMASTFGDDYRKTQVMVHESSVQSAYLFFYNLSLNLPINLNVAHIIGITPSHLKTKKRLFWRGDVVAMMVRRERTRNCFLVESLDADLSELMNLKEFLQKRYQEGYLENLLHYDELQWNSYLAKFRGPTSMLLGAPKSYWGTNAAEKEENFLQDLNELRCAIGRLPLPRHAYMKPITTFKSALRLHKKVTGPPKLPPELERQIFETCALGCPEVCAVLVLVAKRVHMWIDPFLIETVCIKRPNSLEDFLAKLANGKPVEYYAQHIKNLAIFGVCLQTEVINRVLAICTGVERLVLLPLAHHLDFFRNPHAGRNLRRLTIDPGKFRPTPNFYHSCFLNLTHLHLWDKYWSTYAGWETLTSLTHLALVCSGPPEQIMQLMQKLPTVQYVALGHYRSGERYKYCDATVQDSPLGIELWGVRVVVLSPIPEYDWERGTRGEGDFWDVVEQEVEKRLAEASII